MFEMSVDNFESKEARRARVLGVNGEVPCIVFPGPFTNEIAVAIELPDGKKVIGVFDKLYASWDGDLTDDGVQGRFGVRVVEEDDEKALVEFTSNPGMHLSDHSSPRAMIPKEFLLTGKETQ